MLNTKVQDWNIYMQIPPDSYQEFFNSILLGQVNMQVFTEHTNVLLMAQPKSGSHHIHLLLQLALGLFPHPTGFSSTNKDLYYPRVLASKFLDKSTISRSHAHNDIYLSRVIRNLGLKPVVLTRNVFDSIVSRRDHTKRTDPGDDIKSAKQHAKFLQGSNEYQLDVTIEKFANEIIQFYASWDAYTGEKVWITWQEMVDDAPGMVAHVAEELNLEVVEDVEKITAAIKAGGGANFSKGIAGRGRELMNDRQVGELLRRAEILGCTNEEFLG